MQEAKHIIIARYLEEHFPGHIVEQKHDFSRRAQTFLVRGEEGSYLVKVSDELIMDNSASEIQQLLKGSNIPEALRRVEGSGIILTQDGIDSLDS